MKLANDRKLLHHIGDPSPKERAKTEFILSKIDQYLEERGFHIYPTKKEKGTVSFKEVDGSNKEVVLQPSDILRVVFGDINSGDVIVVYSEHLRKLLKEDLTELMKNVKQVDQSTKELILQPSDTVRIVFGDIKTGMVACVDSECLREMVTKYLPGFKEEKPSADGEENLYAGFFSPMGIDWKKICFPEEEKSVSFTPWMKCPVCDGWGSRFDTGPLGSPTNVVECPCCNKSGVIPMCKQTK